MASQDAFKPSHAGRVIAVATSGHRVYSACIDGTVRRWEPCVIDGSMKYTPVFHYQFGQGKAVKSLHVCGKYIYPGGDSFFPVIKQWHMKDTSPVASLTGHKSGIVTILTAQWGNKGHLISAASREVIMWKDDGTPAVKLEHPRADGTIRAVTSFRNDVPTTGDGCTAYILSGTEKGVIRQWDTQGNCVNLFRTNSGVSSFICDKTQSLFIGCANGDVEQWSVAELLVLPKDTIEHKVEPMIEENQTCNSMTIGYSASPRNRSAERTFSPPISPRIIVDCDTNSTKSPTPRPTVPPTTATPPSHDGAMGMMPTPPGSGSPMSYTQVGPRRGWSVAGVNPEPSQMIAPSPPGSMGPPALPAGTRRPFKRANRPHKVAKSLRERPAPPPKPVLRSASDANLLGVGWNNSPSMAPSCAQTMMDMSPIDDGDGRRRWVFRSPSWSRVIASSDGLGVQSLALMGNILVTTRGEDVHLWDTQTGDYLFSCTTKGSGDVNSVAFINSSVVSGDSPDQGVLIAGSDDFEVRMYPFAHPAVGLGRRTERPKTSVSNPIMAPMFKQLVPKVPRKSQKSLREHPGRRKANSERSQNSGYTTGFSTGVSTYSGYSGHSQQGSSADSEEMDQGMDMGEEEDLSDQIAAQWAREIEGSDQVEEALTRMTVMDEEYLDDEVCSADVQQPGLFVHGAAAQMEMERLMTAIEVEEMPGVVGMSGRMNSLGNMHMCGQFARNGHDRVAQVESGETYTVRQNSFSSDVKQVLGPLGRAKDVDCISWKQSQFSGRSREQRPGACQPALSNMDNIASAHHLAALATGIALNPQQYQLDEHQSSMDPGITAEVRVYKFMDEDPFVGMMNNGLQNTGFEHFES